MPVHLTCGCGRDVEAEDGHRGQHVRCPHCGAVIPVPAGTAAKVEPHPLTVAERRRSEGQGQVIIGGVLVVAGLFLLGTPVGPFLVLAGGYSVIDGLKKLT